MKKLAIVGYGKLAIPALKNGSSIVAVAASLASVGPGDTKVKVTSIPGYVGDKHRIEINNEQVKAVIDIYSKTAQIAGWSVVNTLRNITSPIVF